MRVDLDELERIAVSSGNSPVCGQSTTLALIARIRELEAGYRDLLDDFAHDMEDPGDLASDRALLERGVVLP